MHERKSLFSIFTNQLIPELSHSFPDFNFVIRTHPEESDKTYKELLGHLSNVTVIHKDSVYPWISGAEIVIHAGCTTGLEASMLGKLSINCNFLNKAPLAYSYNVNTVDEARLKLDEFLKNADLRKHLEKEYSSYIEDKYIAYSSKKIMSFLSELEVMPTYLPETSSINSKAIEFYLNLLKNYRKVRATLSKARMYKSLFKKFDALSASECDIILKSMKTSDYEFASYTAHNISPNMVLFQVKSRKNG